jgi:hypothetical protein
VGRPTYLVEPYLFGVTRLVRNKHGLTIKPSSFKLKTVVYSHIDSNSIRVLISRDFEGSTRLTQVIHTQSITLNP